jgi:type 1 glutamine amidotransferase
MGHIFKILLLLICISAELFAQPAKSTKLPKQADKRKIVFITGPDSHGKGEHEHNGGATLLAKALNDSVPAVNAVIARNGWPKDPQILEGADAIVIYSDGGSADHMAFLNAAQVNRLTQKGVGLVFLHFSLEVPKGEPGNQFLNWIGGYFETNWSVNPVWEASFASYPDHPVANGVKPFSITDEWYYHLRFTEGMNNITPILQALPPESTLKQPDGTHSNNPYVREAVLEKKELQTLAWAFDRPDGGRGFGFTGGHMHKNWQNDNFRKIVLNAIAWAAKVEVPQNGIPSATPTEAELNALTKRVE